MARVNYLKRQLKPGGVYRRTELANWSKSVDRHLDELLSDGTLQKLSQGMYYVPKETAFGKTPPDEKTLVQSFLKDDRFLLTSNNAYNSLGLGTTQLYNEQTVYNHKRHGKFKLGNRTFNFKMKPHFPKKLTKEFLVVDLVNNLKELAEEQTVVLQNLTVKVSEMDKKKLKQSVAEYGNVKTKKIFAALIHP
ncbi:MAG TPA: DUF6088 family protein [Hanamia sp.]|nr:DUF6088 family protein [Hanamia sp.]